MKWSEFLQDGHGVGSSTRLGMLWGLLVGGCIVIALTYTGDLSWEIFAIFMGASGGVYGFGKWRDSKEVIAETEAEKPAPTVVSENTEVKTESGDVQITSKTKPKRKRK